MQHEFVVGVLGGFYDFSTDTGLPASLFSGQLSTPAALD